MLLKKGNLDLNDINKRNNVIFSSICKMYRDFFSSFIHYNNIIATPLVPFVLKLDSYNKIYTTVF